MNPHPDVFLDRSMAWDPPAALLNWSIALILASCAAFLIILAIVAPGQLHTARGGGPVVLSLLAMAAMFLLRRGRIRASAYLLGAGLWAYTTGIALLLGGLHSMFVIVYPLTIMLAGWLLGSRAAIALAALTAAVCLGFLQAELRGLLPPRPPTPPALLWVVQTSVFVFSALLMNYVASSFRRRIEEVRQLGRDLALRTTELQAREADLYRAQAVAHVGSWVFDLASDKMGLSAETCRIFGLPEGTTGSHAAYLARVHADDRDAVDQAWHAAINAGATFDHEHRILVGRKIRWVRQIAELERGADGKTLRCVGTTQDVTARKQAELRIIAAQTQLKATLDAIPDLLFEVDLDGRFHDYHSPRTELLAVPAADFIGRKVSDILPPDAAEVAMTALREAHETGRSHGRLYHLPLPHGQFWFELSVSRKTVDARMEPRFIVLARDVTERKRVEDELSKARNLLGKTFASLNEAVLIVNSDTREIVACNPAMERIFGYAERDMVGRNTEFMHLDRSGYERFGENMFSALNDDGVYRTEFRMRRKDGSVFPTEHEITEIRDPAGRRTNLVSVVRDITERIQAEDRHARLEAQLRESQKMEALGTLAGGVAHDFNNIIAAIIGNAELARQDVGPAHPAMESLDEIRKASRRAKDLVRQILAFGRRQLLERKVISLAPVVVESARLLRATLPAGVRLEIECAEDAPAVLADATQIEQVLVNLCSNAWHAVQGQDRPAVIEIRLEPRINEPEGAANRHAGSARGPLPPGRSACLSVRDNGRGMDRATRERIFEPFFTTKPVDQGTGLGLAVVHGIAQEHGASIEVESAPGNGSTFRICFPAAQSLAEAAVAPRPEGSAARPGNGKHILYVDDDEAIVFLTKRMLERQGYRVSAFTDPGAALAAVRAQPHDFDLVVSDYNMPGMSGLEVAHALREIRAGLPVALASGFITEELRAGALAEGVRELVFKPDTVDDLCEIVARLASALHEGAQPGRGQAHAE